MGIMSGERPSEGLIHLLYTCMLNEQEHPDVRKTYEFGVNYAKSNFVCPESSTISSTVFLNSP